MPETSRRRFVALGAFGAALGLQARSPADALSIEPIDVPTGRALAAACEDRARHGKLLVQLAARLDGADEAERRALLAAATCPICGCRLQAPE